MKITNRVSINMMSKQPTPIVYAVQGDSARAIAFDLFCSGSPWVLPAGAHVVVRYKRPDGGCGIYDTLPDGSCACEIQAHTAVVAIAQTVLAAVGTVFVQITIEAAGEVLSTFPIILRVEEDLAAAAATPEVYVNLLSWNKTEMDKIAAELHAELNQHAEILSEEMNQHAEILSEEMNQHAGKLSGSFSYVAEDDGQGNVTLKPFHLAGAPNFGLGGFFSKVYSFEEADDLKVPGWYLVNIDGHKMLNSEQVNGLQVVRVDGADRDGASCRQTWLDNGVHPDLEREYSHTSKLWTNFSSATPSYNFGKVYATNERFNRGRVYSVLIHVGDVAPGEYADVELDPLGIDYTKAIVELTPTGRYSSLGDMPGDQKTFISCGSSGLRACIHASAILEDTNGDMEVDTVVGFDNYLTVYNDTENTMDVCCLVKFIDGNYDWDWM